MKLLKILTILLVLVGIVSCEDRSTISRNIVLHVTYLDNTVDTIKAINVDELHYYGDNTLMSYNDNLTIHNVKSYYIMSDSIITHQLTPK